VESLFLNELILFLRLSILVAPKEPDDRECRREDGVPHILISAVSFDRFLPFLLESLPN
jgi:hypothetical protein